MKKIIIILTSVIIVLGAVLFGGYLYNTKLSKEYESATFSFKVPRGFKCISSGDPDDPTPTMYFKCLGEDISIYHFEWNLTPEAFSHKMFSRKDYAKVKKLEGCLYDCYFYSSEETYEDENGIEMSCIIGTDTHFMVINCFCSTLKAKIIMPVIQKMAKSVQYTSDFHLADKPDVYDYDYLSINTGSKYLCYDTTKKHTNKDYIFSLIERYAEADDPDKFPSPVLNIFVYDDGSSPADLANEKYNKELERNNSIALTRDQKELLGFKCEHVYWETGNDETRFCYEYYYFSNGKYTYCIYEAYQKNADEADIKEMLDGITIKDIK